MGRPMLELGTMGKVHCTRTSSGLWQAAASYRGEGGVTRRVKRTAETQEEAVKRLHEACTEMGASSWMKLPPPPPVTPSQMGKPRPPKTGTPTTLYRFFDREDRLLYVGISTDPRQRVSSHRAYKPWWTQSVRIDLEHFSSWDEARAAEKAAIKTENPMHNLADVLSATELAIERVRERYRTDPEFRRSISSGRRDEQGASSSEGS